MFEEEADAAPNKEQMDNLAAIIKRVAKITHEITGTETYLEGLKAELLRIKREDLPNALSEAKLPSVTTEQGRVIERKQIVSGNWPKAENTEAVAKAVAWLKEEKLLDLVKFTIQVDFDKGSADAAQEMFDAIRALPQANSYKALTMKESVHHQTLNAMLRERMMAGKETPLELFNGFTGWFAEISEPKKGKK